MQFCVSGESVWVTARPDVWKDGQVVVWQWCRQNVDWVLMKMKPNSLVCSWKMNICDCYVVSTCYSCQDVRPSTHRISWFLSVFLGSGLLHSTLWLFGFCEESVWRFPRCFSFRSSTLSTVKKSLRPTTHKKISDLSRLHKPAEPQIYPVMSYNGATVLSSGGIYSSKAAQSYGNILLWGILVV